MEGTRTTWTDERLDDHVRHIDQRFDAVDRRFDAVDQRFDAVDKRFEAVDKRFDRVDQDLRGLRVGLGQTRVELSGRIDDLQRTLLQISGAGALGFLATLVSVIATRA